MIFNLFVKRTKNLSKSAINPPPQPTVV